MGLSSRMFGPSVRAISCAGMFGPLPAPNSGRHLGFRGSAKKDLRNRTVSQAYHATAASHKNGPPRVGFFSHLLDRLFPLLAADEVAESLAQQMKGRCRTARQSLPT